eukprot:364697-Chlamydomonas_euryale.AAC.4
MRPAAPQQPAPPCAQRPPHNLLRHAPTSQTPAACLSRRCMLACNPGGRASADLWPGHAVGLASRMVCLAGKLVWADSLRAALLVRTVSQQEGFLEGLSRELWHVWMRCAPVCKL